MTTIDQYFNKARNEVNAAENTLGRALYAIDRAIEARAADVPKAPDTASSSLPALNLSAMRLWKWEYWHASEWDNAFSSYPWRYDHVQWQHDDTVLLRLDNAGAPELQAPGSCLTMAGRVRVDVTLPMMRDGLCVAPLWLYASDKGKKGEIDFEFTKDGLLLTVHSEHTGAHAAHSLPLVFKGEDWSDRRHLLEIEFDIEAGVIQWIVDGFTVGTLSRDAAPDAFPTEPLKTFISMWTAKPGLAWAEGWLGKWAGLPSNERLGMLIHGYAEG